MNGFLKQLRISAGYTQEEVSEAIGIAQPHYSNIENGERRPSPEVAKKLGTFLKFDWTLFYENTSE